NSAPSPRVKLGILVTDKSNHSVDDIKQDTVQVLEDKVPQTISSFARDERPVDYAVVIDTAQAFKYLLVSAIETAKVLIRNNRPTDETFIDRFVSSSVIDTVQEFTSDQPKLLDALGSLYVDEGQSAVVDAVYLSVE